MLRLLLIIIAFLYPLHVRAEPPLSLNYERTIDGDTFVASGRKIRLWGIDAPEKGDHVYLASKLYLETILEEGRLECLLIEQDRYKRDVMQCSSKGLDISSMMVNMGMATDYKRYSKSFYETQEQAARAAKRGVWSEAATIPTSGFLANQYICTYDSHEPKVKKCTCYNNAQKRMPCDEFGPETMRPKPVTQVQQVSLICYDEAFKYMHLKLHDTVYQYCAVPREISAQLEASKNKSAFYTKNIRSKFSCRENLPPEHSNICRKTWVKNLKNKKAEE